MANLRATARPLLGAARATSRAHALALAKGLCRCKRQSFAGVKWWDGREERRLTWAEVDGG